MQTRPGATPVRFALAMFLFHAIAGLNDYRGIPLHVSRGVGMERAFTPPVRFLCPPEVCILDVRLPSRRPASALSTS